MTHVPIEAHAAKLVAHSFAQECFQTDDLRDRFVVLVPKLILSCVRPGEIGIRNKKQLVLQIVEHKDNVVEHHQNIGDLQLVHARDGYLLY